MHAAFNVNKLCKKVLKKTKHYKSSKISENNKNSKQNTKYVKSLD